MILHSLCRVCNVETLLQLHLFASELAMDDFHELVSLVHHFAGEDARMWFGDHVYQVAVRVMLQVRIVHVWIGWSRCSML